MKETSIIHRLRDAGLKPTIARIGILQAIEASAPAHICAEDVFRQMILRGTRASIGTVYRAIHLLEAKGLLLREWGPNRKALYRIKPTDHDAQTHRFVCRSCARCIAFTDPELQARLQWIAQAQGIDLAAQTVTIQVDCAGCSHACLDVEPPRILSSVSTIGPASHRRHARAA